VTADKWWQRGDVMRHFSRLVGSFGRRTMASIKRSFAVNVNANEVELMVDRNLRVVEGPADSHA
jgi:hypothetical protein